MLGLNKLSTQYQIIFSKRNVSERGEKLSLFECIHEIQSSLGFLYTRLPFQTDNLEEADTLGQFNKWSMKCTSSQLVRKFSYTALGPKYRTFGPWYQTAGQFITWSIQSTTKTVRFLKSKFSFIDLNFRRTFNLHFLGKIPEWLVMFTTKLQKCTHFHLEKQWHLKLWLGVFRQNCRTEFCNCQCCSARYNWRICSLPRKIEIEFETRPERVPRIFYCHWKPLMQHCFYFKQAWKDL